MHFIRFIRMRFDIWTISITEKGCATIGHVTQPKKFKIWIKLSVSLIFLFKPIILCNLISRSYQWSHSIWTLSIRVCIISKSKKKIECNAINSIHVRSVVVVASFNLFLCLNRCEVTFYSAITSIETGYDVSVINHHTANISYQIQTKLTVPNRYAMKES